MGRQYIWQSWASPSSAALGRPAPPPFRIKLHRVVAKCVKSGAFSDDSTAAFTASSVPGSYLQNKHKIRYSYGPAATDFNPARGCPTPLIFRTPAVGRL